MDVLSIVHGEDAGAELFDPLVAEADHRLDEWSFGWETPPPQALDAYDAVLVFGNQLQGPETATSVRFDEAGNAQVKDGLFLEGKELVGGYAEVDVVDRDAVAEALREPFGLHDPGGCTGGVHGTQARPARASAHRPQDRTSGQARE